MRLSAKRYAEAFLESVADATETQLRERVKAFIALVRRRRQQRLLPTILREVERRWNEQHGVETVTITTAAPVAVQHLQQMVGTGTDVSAIVDPAIIGGAVIRRGDEVVDASVRSHLQHLQHVLTRKD